MPTVPGLSSGITDPDRPAKPTHACPKCGSPLKGGPVLFRCQLRHAFTAADLEYLNERRMHRTCEAMQQTAGGSR